MSTQEMKDEKLQELISAQLLPSMRDKYPDGWMGHVDLTAIYNIARIAKHAVLEIGPWLGLSTTAICAGLRDSGLSPSAQYDVVDFGITSPEEWERYFRVPFNPNAADRRVADAICHPGGTNAVLIDNLKRNDLLKFTTTIIRGNFLDLPITRKYDYVFCDTTHDEEEAALYLPKISSLVTPGAFLIFDDVIREDFANYICSHFDVRSALMTSLIAEYCKLLVISTY